MSSARDAAHTKKIAALSAMPSHNFFSVPTAPPREMLRRVNLGRAGLCPDHLVHQTPCLNAAPIGLDVDLRRVVIELDIALLRLEHFLVLVEGEGHGLEEIGRALGIVLVEVARIDPEIMAA